MALPLCSLMMCMMMSSGMLRLVVGQHDDCPDERQELEQDPQGGQEQGYAAQGLHFGQAHAPGVPQIHTAPPPHVHLRTLQSQQNTSSYCISSRPFRWSMLDLRKQVHIPRAMKSIS